MEKIIICNKRHPTSIFLIPGVIHTSAAATLRYCWINDQGDLFCSGRSDIHPLKMQMVQRVCVLWCDITSVSLNMWRIQPVRHPTTGNIGNVYRWRSNKSKVVSNKRSIVGEPKELKSGVKRWSWVGGLYIYTVWKVCRLHIGKVTSSVTFSISKGI